MLVQSRFLDHNEVYRQKTDTVFLTDCLYRNQNRHVI